MGEQNCCKIGCDKKAEFQIVPNNGRLDDDTYGCEDHVGTLLGTTYPDTDIETLSYTITPVN